MKILEVPETKRQELTEQGIVICTYEAEGGTYIDGITNNFKTKFKTFKEKSVIDRKDKI